MSFPERSGFVIAATALALRKGGMTACDDSIQFLSDALDAYPCPELGDAIGPAHGRAREVIAARLASDETAFTAAKYALELEMDAFWALRVQVYSRGVRG